MTDTSLAPSIYGSTETIPSNIFAEPLSAEALALSPKPYIDLGHYAVNTVPRVLPSQLKLPGSIETSNKAIENNRNDEEVLEAHRIVLSALQERLDESQFMRSSVYFTHRNWGVLAGTRQAGFSKAWHVDGTKYKESVKAMVLFFDNLPPSILHNPISPNDLDAKGQLISIGGKPMAETPLIDEELPINRLLLLPNVPHKGQTAERWTPQRRFMRWLVVDTLSSAS